MLQRGFFIRLNGFLLRILASRCSSFGAANLDLLSASFLLDCNKAFLLDLKILAPCLFFELLNCYAGLLTEVYEEIRIMMKTIPKHPYHLVDASP